MLIIFGGLPGVGKTTIARELARRLGAMHLRIDSIEQSLCDSEALSQPINDAGYRVAYAVAEDNLRLGHSVIADSVNPLQLTRDAWIAVANRTQAEALEVEITCSDPQQHRGRVEGRRADISGMKLPTWEEVLARDYEPWNREHIVIDTSGKSIAASVEELGQALGKR